MSSSTASSVPVVPGMRWITVWARAVIVPAYRRAVATWLGCTIIGGLLFGPTAMRPSDLTELALHDPGIGVVLAGTWMLLFVPTARLIVRPRVGFLYSLPGDPRLAQVVGALSLLVLQLPWLALWLAGEGAVGGIVIAATTIVAAGLARWQPPQRRPRFPIWGGPGRALWAIHVRALRRRAGDAIVRGTGLAVIAGLAGGLFVRNNQLAGTDAAVMAASVIAVLAIPAQLGAGQAAFTTHRETAWLAASTGISRTTRIATLVAAVAGIHVVIAAIASVAAMALAGANGWLPVVAITTAIGTALGEVRPMLVHDAHPSVGARVTIGAFVAASVAVLCLSLLGASGALAMIAIGVVAIGMVKS